MTLYWLSLAMACDGSPKSPESKERTPTTDDSTIVTAESRAEDCAPMQALAELDDRQPVPLRPMMAWHQKQNMLEHLVAIQRIVDGLSRENWEEVAAAAALIETSPQMERTCQHMGAGAVGFTEMALDFHDRAKAISESARRRDKRSALRATAHTLEACTTCHAAFRQEVVDEATWRSRASAR